jgi:hypothetical protein
VEPSIRGGNARASVFSISMSSLTGYRSLLSAASPSQAPNPWAAREYIAIYNRFQRRLTSRCRQQLQRQNPNCIAFIRYFQRELQIPFDPNSQQGIERVNAMVHTMQDFYDRMMSGRRGGEAFLRWYDGLPNAVRQNTRQHNRAFRYFSWVLIAEKMSSE